MKTWITPKLTVHGSVEAITEKTVAKTLGAGDDLATVIKTNPAFGSGGNLS